MQNKLYPEKIPCKMIYRVLKAEEKGRLGAAIHYPPFNKEVQTAILFLPP